MEMIKEVATDERTQMVIDLADVMTFEEETTGAGLELACHVAKNTRRYVDLFQNAIDALLPDTAALHDLQSKEAKDDVINIIIQRRRQRLADRIAENNERNPEDLFPPAHLRK